MQTSSTKLIVFIEDYLGKHSTATLSNFSPLMMLYSADLVV